MRYIITIDEGTTSLRVVLYDVKKNCIANIERRKFKQIFPKPSWVEHDAEEIYQKTLECFDAILKTIKIEEVYGIGITNQRETVVAWDKTTGRPLHNAIVWQCKRTKKFCEKLRKGKYGKYIYKSTGLIPDAYFSASKIKWLIDNVDGVKRELQNKNLCVGTIESFLVYRLTKGKHFVTDVTNASRTMLFNINTLCWDEKLLDIFNIPIEILPTIVNNDQVVGDAEVFDKPIKIAGLIGDQQSSLFGQGCFEEGMAKNTYGTGCFMLLNTGNKPLKSKFGLLTTVGFKTKDMVCYALEGSVFNAGSVVNWAIDNLNIAKDTNELTNLAYQIDSNDGVYLVPAFSGIGTPYWDMDARGIICGLTRGCDKRHIARAVLESMAYSSYDVLVAMQRDAHGRIIELNVDGGASKNEKLMQFQSDILGVKINKQNDESTCLGAVFMTGLATGAYKDIFEIRKCIKVEKEYLPNKNLLVEVKNNLLGWNKAVKRSLTEK